MRGYRGHLKADALRQTHTKLDPFGPDHLRHAASPRTIPGPQPPSLVAYSASGLFSRDYPLLRPLLDPDTGIATSRVNKPCQYLRPSELHTLLGAHPSRIVAVYQHIRAIPTRERLKRIVSARRSSAKPFYCCSYESPTVAMMFFSRDASRIHAIHQNYAALLGRHTAKRTHIWEYPVKPVG